MALCELCRNIPFENPPPLPPPYLKAPVWPYRPTRAEPYHIENRDPDTPSPRTFGYLHHQSQEALQMSAGDCALCELIYQEFRRTIEDVPHPTGDYPFFLTSRARRQQGFQVWTLGDSPDIIWRVGAYSFGINAVGDPLAKVFRGYRICSESSAEAANDMVKGWVDHCVHHHSLCGPRQGAITRLPTRVLDLGTSASSSVRLLETNGTMTGFYTSLSYTWGPKPHPYETTKSNIAAYKSEIHFSGRVPQTIVDAIEVTWMIGIRYLWVDALCILQDDAADWASESAKMLDYYGNSYLTISAAASDSAYRGMFNRRSPPPSVNIPYTSDSGITGAFAISMADSSKETYLPNNLSMAEEPISSRAWTLQERILSSRNVFYAGDQIYYECEAHFLSENGFYASGRQTGTNPSTENLSLYIDIDGITDKDFGDVWARLLQNYGAREMFDPDSNKFVAFGGLAEKFASLFSGDTYIAGLWKNELIEQLFWATDNDPDTPRPAWNSTWPPAKYRSPSWSWACMDTAIFMPDARIKLAEKHATYVDHHFSLVNPKHLYGQVADAYIILRVPAPIRIRHTRTHMEDGPEGHDWSWPEASSSTTISVQYSTRFDYYLSPEQLKDTDTYALVLGRDSIFSQDNIKGVNYLCLLVAKVAGDTYRRMGTIWLDEHAMGLGAGQLEETKYVDVKLI